MKLRMLKAFPRFRSFLFSSEQENFLKDMKIELKFKENDVRSLASSFVFVC